MRAEGYSSEEWYQNSQSACVAKWLLGTRNYGVFDKG